MLVDETAEPMPLPLSLLEDITRGFSYDLEIGRGGCAVVYKGILRKGILRKGIFGDCTVAVKRLFDATMDEQIFQREIQCLMQVKHKNVVRFLGYCADRQGNMAKWDGEYVMADVHQRLLVFEYVPNGSLYKCITDKHCEWAMCYKIIKGICEGIQYLHDNRIVHLDVKPANILLDNNMSPKISDFGLSRWFKENQSQHITKTRNGTLGYIAPELLEEGVITFGTDLYSLGVVIIEILTGHRLCQDIKEVLKIWSHRLERSQRDKQCKQIQVCYEIALECIDDNPKNRPDSAKNIIDRLHGVELVYAAEELSIKMSTSALAFRNMVGVELMTISDVSHNTLSGLLKLYSLRRLHFKRCNDNFFSEQDDKIVLSSVQYLHLEDLSISGELFSKVLRFFPALSKLTITDCKNLELVPVENGGLLDLRMIQSFTGYNCGKVFSRWPIGEVGGGAHATKTFPTCLRELNIFLEPSMQSMALLSKLTSLTRLYLKYCEELTMDGFNPLITVKIKKLSIYAMSNNQMKFIAGDLLSEIGRSRLLHAGSFQLEEFKVDSTSAVLTTPICSHLSVCLDTLIFSFDQQVTAFTKEQEQALQLLTSLQFLYFIRCKKLQSLPQRLPDLSSLKILTIHMCGEMLSLPPKDGLPTSLEALYVSGCSPELIEQAKRLKGADPWFSVEIREY
ncbi:unnamed protein product [Alopecurus aequalis]